MFCMRVGELMNLVILKLYELIAIPLQPPPTSVIFQFEQLAQLERIKNEELCPTLLKVFNDVKAGDSV